VVKSKAAAHCCDFGLEDAAAVVADGCEKCGGHVLKLAKVILRFLEQVKRERAANTFRSYHGRLKPLAHDLGKKKVRKLSAKQIANWIDEETHWPDGAPKAPRFD
jgi:PHP family Zn ribbon phosphoesterase